MMRIKWAVAPIALAILAPPATPADEHAERHREWLGARHASLRHATQEAPKAAEDARRAEEDARRAVEVIRIGGGGWLGVGLDEVTKEEAARLKLAEERGALVKSVEPDSPAAKAGLKADDVILKFQGEAVHTAAQLARLVREAPAGRTVSLDVSRGGAAQKLSATLAERKGMLHEWSFNMPEIPELPDVSAFRFRVPEAPAPPDVPRLMWRSQGPRKLGIEYQEVAEQLAKYFKLADDRGVLVTHVEADSPAAKGGLKAGDVILKIAGAAVRDGGDLRDEMRKTEAGQEITITVQRDGKPLDLKVKLGGEPHRTTTRSGHTT